MTSTYQCLGKQLESIDNVLVIGIILKSAQCSCTELFTLDNHWPFGIRQIILTSSRLCHYFQVLHEDRKALPMQLISLNSLSCSFSFVATLLGINRFWYPCQLPPLNFAFLSNLCERNMARQVCTSMQLSLTLLCQLWIVLSDLLP